MRHKRGDKRVKNKIITKIENTASAEQVSRVEQTARTPREEANKGSLCEVGRGGGRGVIVAAMVCTFVTTIPGPWKRRARRLPIGQIQAVPGNFLHSDSPRRNSASAPES